MNRLSTAFAVLALIAGSVAVAQTPSQDPTSPSGTPSNVDPSATAPVPSTSVPSTSDQSTAQPAQSGDTSGASNGKAHPKALIKDCVAQQRANNPQMSKHDATKACKDQVNSSSPR